MAGRRSLEEKVLEAFEAALEEDRMDVAEHLLRALEASVCLMVRTARAEGQRTKPLMAA